MQITTYAKFQTVQYNIEPQFPEEKKQLRIQSKVISTNLWSVNDFQNAATAISVPGADPKERSQIIRDNYLVWHHRLIVNGRRCGDLWTTAELNVD